MRTEYQKRSGLTFIIMLNLLLSSGIIFSNTAYTGMRENITSLEYTCEMGAGINLFNTLDATCDYQSGLATELCWGQPYTTKEMITSMKSRGFETLRIPTTWYNHMGQSPNYTIDEDWMDRVEEVANFAFENDMHVIINIHHDDLKSTRPDSWLFPSYEKQDANRIIIEKIWTQIATRFKDYGDYLIFETLNEPRPVETQYEWNGGTAEHRDVINHYNKVALDAIRATGGNNSLRFVMVPQVAAQLNAAVNDLVIPNNDSRVLISVHHYSPYSFALNTEGTSDWGSAAEIQALDNDIKKLYDKYILNGIGVVMGEWGAQDKGNLEQRVNYYDVYSGIMKKYQVVPVIWMFTFNRTSGIWSTPELEEAILQHFENACTEGLPTIRFSNITFGQTFLSSSDIEVQVEAIDDDGSIDYVKLYLNEELISVDSTLPYLWNNQSQVDALTNTSAGSYVLRVEAGDNEGNISNKELTFLVVDSKLIPGRIEAEDFWAQQGIETEPTADVDGINNVGFIQNGDYTEYHVEVSQSGTYEVSLRAATETAGGNVEFLFDNKNVSSVSIDDSQTDGWQDWYTSEPMEVSLDEGIYIMKLNFTGGSSFLFNLNWVEFKIKEVVSVSSSYDNQHHSVYPNPTTGYLILPSSQDWSITDILGKEIETGTGLNVDISHLEKGNYFIKQSGITYKVIKN